MPKQRTERRKRKSFYGNQFVKPDKQTKSDVDGKDGDEFEEPCALTSSDRVSSASSRKLLPECTTTEKQPKEPTEDVPANSVGITGYRLVDVELLGRVFSSLRCADCGCFTLTLMENTISRKGCASELRVFCQNCGWRNEFYTSKKQSKSFEVNRRLVYSMRSLGKGHSGAKKFCTMMNMPPPSTAKPFSKSSKTITKHIKMIAKKSMADAAADIRKSANAQETDVISCPVSCDGTWQRRGFSSLNGCVMIMSIDTGKVLDTEALSRCCKQCQQHSHLDKESEEYRLWKADHTNCKANFKGSAPAMEPEGAERMFRRSVETHKLRYSELYGDGETKTHQQIKDVYQGTEVVKQECIGHVQK